MSYNISHHVELISTPLGAGISEIQVYIIYVVFCKVEAYFFGFSLFVIYILKECESSKKELFSAFMCFVKACSYFWSFALEFFTRERISSCLAYSKLNPLFIQPFLLLVLQLWNVGAILTQWIILLFSRCRPVWV